MPQSKPQRKTKRSKAPAKRKASSAAKRKTSAASKRKTSATSKRKTTTAAKRKTSTAKRKVGAAKRKVGAAKRKTTAKRRTSAAKRKTGRASKGKARSKGASRATASATASAGAFGSRSSGRGQHRRAAGTGLPRDVLRSFEEGQRTAVEAVRRFVETVEDAVPARGPSGPRGQEVIESALEMAERLVQTQYDLLRRVVRSAGRTFGDSVRRR